MLSIGAFRILLLGALASEAAARICVRVQGGHVLSVHTYNHVGIGHQQAHIIINPQRMHEDYYNRFVCVCVLTF